MKAMSLRARLLLWLLVALVLLLLPLGVLTVREAQRAAVSGLERTLFLRLGFLRDTGTIELRQLAEAVQQFGGGVGFLWNPLQGPLYTDSARYELPVGLPEALISGQSFQQLQGDTLWVALPTETGGVGLGVRLAEVAALPQRLFQLYAVLGLGLLLVAAAVGGWGLSLSLRPLEQLSQEIAKRNPDYLEPLPTPNLPELNKPVASLNALIHELSHAIQRMKQQESSAKRFAYGASHELRNPLAALKGYLEVLRRHPNEERAIRGAWREALRMESLLSGLLTLARLEGRGRAEGQPLDLAAFVQQHSEVEAQGIGTVLAEPELLLLALENLLKNAAKYGVPPIEVHLQTEGDGVWLWVHDHGPGFAASMLPRAFEPFVKLSDGTGLGLAIVAAVAQVHGGKVLAQNLSQGAKVGLWLPSA